MNETKDFQYYYTVAEVAERLTVKPEMIRVMIRKKELKAIKFGNKFLISSADLKKVLERYEYNG